MKSFKPFGPSLGKGKLSKNIVKVINNEIDKTIINKKNDYSSKLVSQIKNEIKFSKNFIQKKLAKELGEKTIEQIPETQLSFKSNSETNNINTIVKHLSGNMVSRWSDFLNSDGEKEWRNRDDEFIDTIKTKPELMNVWNKGWKVLFDTLENLSNEDLNKIIFIRNEGHTVIECINRQLCHYSYHIGQIVMIGKVICGEKWETLSIQKGDSENYNSLKFSNEKEIKNFLEK